MIKKYKKFCLLIVCVLIGLLQTETAFSKQAKPSGIKQSTWIWYPGDMEIWLHRVVTDRREEKNKQIRASWKISDPYRKVVFSKTVALKYPETINVYAQGQFVFSLDGKEKIGAKSFNIPAGKHELTFVVSNEKTLPALFVSGKTIKTDGNWKAAFENKHEAAGHWKLNNPTELPENYKLSRTEIKPIATTKKQNGILVDFGKETFGYLIFKNLKGKGIATIYYGESIEEANSPDSCEVFDQISLDGNTNTNLTMPELKAFRYVNIVFSEGLSTGEVSAFYEYLPLSYRGKFRSSNEKLNKIWDISAYTFHLNTREFFLDGIKRDRWVWSGDAYQSYLMNYYLFFDQDVNLRTMYALRDKDPITMHMNTILDYSFYWFIGIYDNYVYTGDEAFLKKIYPRMVTMMDFCLNRRNKEGMVEGLKGDWVFIDWAKMDKKGEVSFEQILFARSLEAMATCAKIAGDVPGAVKYQALADELKKKTMSIFWNEEKHALMNNRVDGKVSELVTKYANMFAIMFNFLDSGKVEEVKKHVLLNNDIQKITTPYMRFFELDALGKIGQHKYVMDEILSYWGGMLDLGATTFWEQYKPNEKGKQHLAMYGRPYAKSLCHAWGASPLYLLGKYFVGVKPLSKGYESYLVEPNLGGLKWLEGSVPTPKGDILVFIDHKELRVTPVKGKAIIRLYSKTVPKVNDAKVTKIGSNHYEVALNSVKPVTITYTFIEKNTN